MLIGLVQERPSRIDVDPIARVFVMENHDDAYRLWHDAGVKQRVLIHLDAHHDMWWVPDTASTTIANFICPALRDDIVKEVVWVVPDPAWETSRSRRHILRHVRRIIESYPGPSHRFRLGNNQVSTRVLGKSLTVCSLASLPRFDETVLLDIDVDFLVTPRVSHGKGNEHRALPWCWPEDLLAGLCAGNIRSDLVTIAYSVEGGYTPLKWKYLGDELAVRLRQPSRCLPTIQGMRLMRDAAFAAHEGELEVAEEKYHQAMNLLPTSPGPSYHLAYLCVGVDRIAEAQKYYQRALAIDPSYRTASNSGGLLCQSGGRLDLAQQEFLWALALDPQDVYAHLGLGRLAAQRGRWSEAEALLRQSLALDSHLTDSYRALGDVLVKQGRREEAIRAYEQSLKVALAGHKPLEAPIATSAECDRPSDPDHSLIHARLARLYELEGDASRAISSYQISIAGGYDGVFLRSRLAHLYLKEYRWQKSAEEVWKALKMVPFELSKAGRRLGHHLRRAIKGALKLCLPLEAKMSSAR